MSGLYDLTLRLRMMAMMSEPCSDLCLEAATEIERLRRTLGIAQPVLRPVARERERIALDDLLDWIAEKGAWVLGNLAKLLLFMPVAYVIALGLVTALLVGHYELVASKGDRFSISVAAFGVSVALASLAFTAAGATSEDKEPEQRREFSRSAMLLSLVPHVSATYCRQTGYKHHFFGLGRANWHRYLKWRKDLQREIRARCAECPFSVSAHACFWSLRS